MGIAIPTSAVADLRRPIPLKLQHAKPRHTHTNIHASWLSPSATTLPTLHAARTSPNRNTSSRETTGFHLAIARSSTNSSAMARYSDAALPTSPPPARTKCPKSSCDAPGRAPMAWAIADSRVCPPPCDVNGARVGDCCRWKPAAQKKPQLQDPCARTTATGGRGTEDGWSVRCVSEH